MLNWDEYNKDEAAVVQQEAMTAKPVVPDCLNPQGNVQGGMITSVLDDCTALCVLFSTKGKRFPNTTDFHTTFHRPLSLEPATIKASILKIGKNIVSVEGKVFKEKNKLVASCLHTGFLFDTHGMKK